MLTGRRKPLSSPRIQRERELTSFCLEKHQSPEGAWVLSIFNPLTLALPASEEIWAGQGSRALGSQASFSSPPTALPATEAQSLEPPSPGRSGSSSASQEPGGTEAAAAHSSRVRGHTSIEQFKIDTDRGTTEAQT